MTAEVTVGPMSDEDDFEHLNEGNPLAWQAAWWRDLTQTWSLQWLTASIDGTPAGFAALCPLPVAVQGYAVALVHVRPEHRRRGVATALRSAVESAARGVRPGVVYSHLQGDPAAEAAVRAWGLPVVGMHHESVLDLTAVDRAAYAALAHAPGLTLAPVALDRLDDAGWRELHAFVHARFGEAPDSADGGGAMPYEGFRELLTEDWMLLAATEGEVRLGVAVVTRRPSGESHANTVITGVLAEARGRGIATALKARHALVMAEHGITHLYTQNREGNEPILAANRTLGFERADVVADVACSFD